MKEKQIIIKNGIDPRTTADLVQLCSKFKSDIKLQHDTKIANAKSIMGMISLSILEEAEITLICEGLDEEEAVKQVSEFLAKI